MKQLKFLFGFILIAAMAAFTSCSNDEDPVNPDNAPSINFIGGTGYISANQSITAGTAYKIGINANSNSNTGAKLTKLIVQRVYNNVPQIWDTTINTNAFNITFTDTAVNVGPTNWIFTIYDNDNQSKAVSLTVTVTAAAGEINTFSMKIMGAQGSPTGSSFASIDGSVYSLADAKLNAAKVDWMYYYGATNLATIAAPSDPTATEVFTGANGPASWQIRNNTQFKKVTDQIDWNSITDDTQIVAQTASGVNLTKIPQLQIGNVLSFIAANGKKGMIKVESISGTENGTITISVKVQK